jgi:endogenous inhibitor of DNA gyrase (YacG/DUF329 family)
MMPCPICKKPAVARFRPFCSQRCADLDLGRWFNESYAVPVRADEDEDGEAGETGLDRRDVTE